MRSTAFSTMRLGNFSLQDRAGRALLDAADITGVMAVDLLLALPAGEHDLLGIDHDDVVTVIDMRRVGRLVLAAQPQRDDAGKPADDEAGGIDHHPFLLDIGGLGRKALHDRVPGISALLAGSYTKARLVVNAGRDPQRHQKLASMV